MNRKPANQVAVLIVDEFSGLADGSMSGRVEKARSFNTSLVLAPQVIEGMGGRDETARILGSIGTLISHRVNTPDEIVRLAGTHQIPKSTTRIAEDGVTRDRSIHRERELRSTPTTPANSPKGTPTSSPKAA